MSDQLPYRVEVNAERGCVTCGHGYMFEVVGPDETALGQSWGDRGDAQYMADCLNAAYELGCAAGRKQLPPEDHRALMADYLRELRKDAEMPEHFEVLLLPDQYGGPAQQMQVHGVDHACDGRGKLVRITVA